MLTLRQALKEAGVIIWEPLEELPNRELLRHDHLGDVAPKLTTKEPKALTTR